MIGLTKVIGFLVIVALVIMGGKWVWDKIRNPLRDEFSNDLD